MYPHTLDRNEACTWDKVDTDTVGMDTSDMVDTSGVEQHINHTKVHTCFKEGHVSYGIVNYASFCRIIQSLLI